MRTTAKTLGGIAAACMIISAPVVVALASADAATAAKSASARAAGTSYASITKQGGVSITTSKDAHQIFQALFTYKQTCSDGDTVDDFDRYIGIPIGANRRFKLRYDSGSLASDTPGATYSYTSSFDGVLSKSGSKITGTARATYAFVNPAGGSYTCDSGLVKFTARD